MPLHKTLTVLVAAATLPLLAGVSLAGIPWGGDDTGFIPPVANFRCEAGFAKITAKFSNAVIKCHSTMAVARFSLKPFDEEACEIEARAKADASVLRLRDCPLCLDTTAILDYTVADLDAVNGTFFCSGVEPFGGDDTGFVPLEKGTLKCERGILKTVGKLSAAIVKCHTKYADAVLKGKVFDEEACETAAKVKADATNANLAPVCAPCLGPVLPGISAVVEERVDLLNGDTWCASPSGAFID